MKYSFESTFNQFDWNVIKEKIYSCTSNDVHHVLSKNKRTIDDFLILLSPAAAPFIEQMAQISQTMTQKRFGKTIQLYAPLYLSNECQNICTYCGFSLDNKIKRKTLSNTEILLEAKALKEMGVNHILLVSGEANKTVGMDYFKQAIRLLRPHFTNLSIEVQPLLFEEYAELHHEGIHSVLVYQET
ncbi:MAG TPA: radical SAM protein, partial [Mariniphaga sp.]|nr:radical SAM protein [Mariniphaga sp.]